MTDISVGGPIDETDVTFCVYGDDLDPDEVSSILGCTPTRSQRRGVPSSPRRQPAKIGAWFLELRGLAREDPQRVITSLLDRLPSDEAIVRRLGERFLLKLNVVLHLDAWTRGFELPAALLARIVRLGLALGVSIYAHGEETPSGDQRA